jgi:DNA-binding CsgD family transcriptional regulator
VEIFIANVEIDAARGCVEELSATADMLGAPLLRAVADRAEGQVLLASGDPSGALKRLRSSHAAWRAVDAPYEVATTRLLIGDACAAVGDESSAELEREAAREAFAALGAHAPSARAADAPGGLTTREVEVLRLVASGMTNRQIAESLVLSEKTVARHVANIFTKIGVTSRSAATAYAFQHRLV